MTSAPIVHLAMRAQWIQAQDSGRYLWSTRGMTIAQVGYMHCAFTNQVDGVLSRFYANVDRSDLVVLALDIPYLEAHGFQLKVEPVNQDDPESEAFPHLYGGDVPVAGFASAQELA